MIYYLYIGIGVTLGLAFGIGHRAFEKINIWRSIIGIILTITAWPIALFNHRKKLFKKKNK